MALNWVSIPDRIFKTVISITHINTLRNNVMVLKDIILGNNAEQTDQNGHIHDGKNKGSIISHYSHYYWK